MPRARALRDVPRDHPPRRARLAAAGCPVTPEGIGVKAADVHVTALRAQIIRNRYTILGLAQDTGRLDALARELDTIW